MLKLFIFEIKNGNIPRCKHCPKIFCRSREMLRYFYTVEKLVDIDIVLSPDYHCGSKRSWILNIYLKNQAIFYRHFIKDINDMPKKYYIEEK